MKIGILTFHFNCNFGARLQCMALQRVLQQMGHEVEVIDYDPIPEVSSPLWRGWGLSSKKVLSNIRRRWINLHHGEGMRRCFRQFSKDYLSLSSPCNSAQAVAEAASSFDALIVGSDQVWNLAYYQEPVYFLDLEGYGGRRLSYAACCGHSELPQKGREDIRRALLAFTAISVRNEVTFEWVHTLTGLTPQIVCDPTVLYDFPELIAPPQAPFPRYILAYVMDAEIQGGHARAIDQIRRVYGNLPVVVAASPVGYPQSYPWADHVVWEAGPREWVNLIANTDFVYTDSFHGAIFSMKHRRPFLAYYAQAIRAGRLRDLAKRYGVESAIVSGLEEARQKGALEKALDYGMIEEKMARHREQSLAFLQTSLHTP